MSIPNDPDSESPPDPAEGHENDVEPPEETAPPDDSTGLGGQATVRLTPEEVAEITEQSHPTDPDDPLVGTLLRDKWRVLARIGAGSFGTVYKVQDKDGGWIEALKILRVDRLRGPEADSTRKRFLREARIMKRLGSLSPHIVGLSTYEDDIEAGLIYFLMEHVEGRVLSEVLLDEGPLGIDRTIRIALQVCDALIAAHEGEDPVVHRDLKLENLMLTTDREGEESIKVLDFGIAKLAEQDADSRLTQAGTLGTPGYAAPEQLRAEEVDGRTDLFAFGVILYSLVTGRNPWLGHLAYQPTNQTYELMAASDRAQVLPFEESGAEVPQGMIDLILKLLKREPADRYQSARELRDALYELGGGAVSGGLGFTKEFRPPVSGGPTVPERRLAAVWFADLVGYSTLSSQDEEAALALLEVFHKTARRTIEAGGGRVVQFIGDAAFAEFSSTQRAVVTAKDFVDAFTEDTSEYSFTPLLRVGIHVGDVLMAADGDLFGDGVNVAARIQNEAEPGQILVSQDVWRQLKQRRDFGFVSIGERSLKGIGAPVSLYALVEAGDVATTGDLGVPADPTTGLPLYAGAAGGEGSSRGGKVRFAAAAAIAILAVGGGGYAAMTVFGAPETGSLASPLPPTGGDDAPPIVDSAVVIADAGGGPGGDRAGGAGNETDTVTADTPTEPVPPTGGDDPVDDKPERDVPPIEDRWRDAFEQLQVTLSPIRNGARQTMHPELQARFGEAEAIWSRAYSAAEAGLYEDAAADLRAASPIYDEVTRESDTMREVDAARRELDALRPDARDPDLRRDAEERERAATQAVLQGRYSGALRELNQASSLLRRAAAAPEPPPEPVVVPAEVAAEVLARLKAAMEAEDIARVRAVFTSIGEEAAGVENFFRFASDLTVTYDVVSVDTIEPGERFEVTVETEYAYAEADQPQAPPPQIFTIARSASNWVIVASRAVGEDRD